MMFKKNNRPDYWIFLCIFAAESLKTEEMNDEKTKHILA